MATVISDKIYHCMLIYKQYERLINAYLLVTYECANRTDCCYIVDVGSGLGHFLRTLSYVHGLKTCGIEIKAALTKQAIKLDSNFENSLSKQNLYYHNISPIHITKQIHENMTEKEFVALVKTAFGVKKEEFRFGIVGLHPCGDLGPILLRIFSNCREAKFINLVGCCYMKLTTNSEQGRRKIGFPMSEFCLKNNYSLGYNSLEIACHAVENYIVKLKSGNVEDLRIHSFRAMLEKLLKMNFPTFCHRRLSNVKYKNNLKFEQYCHSALRDYKDINIKTDIINSQEVELDLSKWSQVVIFYSIRLLFAPLIESIILYDRYLFLNNTGIN